MTNSQRWSIWIVVVAVALLVAVFTGGTFLAVVLYVMGSVFVSTGWLLVLAVTAGAARKRSG